MARSCIWRRQIGGLDGVELGLVVADTVTVADSDHTVARCGDGRRDGSMVDDFAYAHAPRQVHVLNAPSPAATAALEIGRQIVDELETESIR